MVASYLAPPTRREWTIALFGICVFVLSYNFNSSLHVTGIDHTARAALSKTLGRSGAASADDLGTQLGTDGRRLPAWRDSLEDAIFGKWDWREDAVADGSGRPPVGEGDRYMEGAVWGPQLNGSLKPVADDGEDAMRRGWATASTNAGQVHWDTGVPETTLKQHVPGYTILDNVFFVSGTLFIVTDNPKSFPAIGHIISHKGRLDEPPNVEDIEIISTSEAFRRFGTLGTIMHGTTWAIMGSSTYQDSHNLLSIWRLHTSLDTLIPPTGVTSIPPPMQLFYPHIDHYTDHNKDPKSPVLPPRSYTGVDAMLLKAVLPSIGVQHSEDWEDFVGLSRPFVFARLVLVDRGAATRGASGPGWAPPLLSLQASLHWLTPLRNALVSHLRIEDSQKKIVTYLSVQHEKRGPKMRDTDDRDLVKALQKAASSRGYQFVHVDGNTTWEDRMKAVVSSTVVLGVTGDALMDSIFMKSNSHATVVELFPPTVFLQDVSIPASSLDINYIAFQQNKMYMQKDLPEVAAPRDYMQWIKEHIQVDAKAVTNAVNDVMSRA